jgi:hypothetical protein
MSEIKIATIGGNGTPVYIPTSFTCGECNRVFDMFDETDAEEWHYGHDCEAVMTECPNHGGAYDCTPFCELCAGEQEVSA